MMVCMLLAQSIPVYQRYAQSDLSLVSLSPGQQRKLLCIPNSDKRTRARWNTALPFLNNIDINKRIHNIDERVKGDRLVTPGSARSSKFVIYMKIPRKYYKILLRQLYNHLQLV